MDLQEKVKKESIILVPSQCVEFSDSYDSYRNKGDDSQSLASYLSRRENSRRVMNFFSESLRMTHLIA